MFIVHALCSVESLEPVQLWFAAGELSSSVYVQLCTYWLYYYTCSNEITQRNLPTIILSVTVYHHLSILIANTTNSNNYCEELQILQLLWNLYNCLGLKLLWVMAQRYGSNSLLSCLCVLEGKDTSSTEHTFIFVHTLEWPHIHAPN